jgi:hypothetical protein
MIPEIIPEIRGAPDAKAIPRHKGIATKNTAILAGRSFLNWSFFKKFNSFMPHLQQFNLYYK